MRLLQVHYTPPGVIGGVEHILRQHASLLEDRGWTVITAAGREGGPDVICIPELDVAGPENIALEAELAAGIVGPRFHGMKERIAHALEPLAQAADTVIAHNAFTLHFSLPLTAVLWDIARTRVPGSTIAWCHDLSWTNPLYLPSMHDGFPWDLLRLPAPGVRYVTISQERRRELLDLWGDSKGEVTVVPNGVDAVSFLGLSPEVESIARRMRLVDRGCVLLLPVRITRRKNIEAAIRALRVLADGGVDACLLLSGPTAPHHPSRSREYAAELRSLAAELEVADRTIFLTEDLGRNLEHYELAQLYRLSDVLILPSYQEGFGLPLLEAGLARLPLVLSDIAIFREIAGEDALFFALDEDAGRIAGQVQEALSSGTSRLFRRVLRQYSWEAIVEQDILPLLTSHPDIGP